MDDCHGFKVIHMGLLLDRGTNQEAKPRVSLTVPNCNLFAQVSLMVLDIFLNANAKANKTNLWISSTEYQASFTDKEFFSFENGI